MTNELSIPMSKLRARFLDDPGVSLLHLAEEVGIPIEQVEDAANEGNWMQQKREHLAAKYESRNAEYREMASQRRLPLVERQLEVVEKLQTRILMSLDECEDNDSRELRRMSETINSVTATLHNLLGIKEALTTEKKSDGGTNLFFIPTAAPVKNVKSIHI